MEHFKNGVHYHIPLVHIEAKHLDCSVDTPDIANVCSLASHELFVPKRRYVLRRGLNSQNRGDTALWTIILSLLFKVWIVRRVLTILDVY